MALKWAEVESNPDFQAMSPDEQLVAQQQYFDQEISPNIPEEDWGIARSQFLREFGRGIEDTGQPKAAAVIAGGLRGAASVPSGIVGGAGAVASIIPGLQDNFLQRTGRSMKETSEEIFPVNPLFEEDFTTKAGGAVGQAAGQLGTMMAAAPLNLGARGLQAVGLTTAGLMGAEQGDIAAEKYGVTDPLKRAAMILGYGAAEAGFESVGGYGGRGFSEALLGRMSDFSGSALKRFAKTAAVEGLEEVPTGQTQDWLTMALAEEDPNNPGFSKTGYQMPPSFFSRENLNKRAEEFALGAVGGSLFGGVNLIQNDSSSNQGMRLRHAATQRISELESKQELSEQEQAELSDLKEQDSAIATQLEQRGVQPEAQSELLEKARTYDRTFSENLARVSQAAEAALNIQEQQIINTTEPAIAQAEANPDTQATAQAAAEAQNELLDTSTQDVLEAAQEELGEQVKASIPIIVTRDMAQQLLDLGYTRKQVNAMKPEEAQAILSFKTKPTKSNAPQQIQQPEIFPEERESGGQIGETLETVSGDSVLSETRGPEEGQVTPTDEQLIAETNSSIISRTAPGVERDKAFSSRKKAATRLADSLKPGDVVEYDGELYEVASIPSGGFGFAKGSEGKVDFSVLLLAGEARNAQGEKISTPAGKIIRKSSETANTTQETLTDEQVAASVPEINLADITSLEVISQGTSESDVYRRGNEAIKVAEEYNAPETIGARVRDKLLADKLLGDGNVRLEGYYRGRKGVLNPVFAEPFIEGRGATQQEIDSMLEQKGFVPHPTKKGRYLIESNRKIYEAQDLDSGNVLVDQQGVPHVIDASVFEIENPTTEELQAVSNAKGTQLNQPSSQSVATDASPSEAQAPSATGAEQAGGEAVAEEAPPVAARSIPKWMAQEVDSVLSTIGPKISAEIENLADQGRTAKEIAKSLNLSEEDVLAARVGLGIPSREIAGPGGSRSSNPDFAVWQKAYRERKAKQVAPKAQVLRSRKAKRGAAKKASKDLSAWAENKLKEDLDPITRQRVVEFRDVLAPMVGDYESLFADVQINPYFSSQSGVKMWEDGSLYINPRDLFNSLAIPESFDQSQKLFSRILDEEFRHSVALELERTSPEFSRNLEDVWNALPKEVQDLSAQAYQKAEGKKYVDDWQARHEFFRQYWQNTEIRDITENALREKGVMDRLYDLIDSFIQALKRLQQGSVPEAKPILDRLLAEAQQRADEIRGESQKTEASPAKDQRDAFVESVGKAANAIPVEKRWGPDKVFITDLFKEWSKTNPTVTLYGFKSMLKDARDKIQLARVDLVEAMTPEQRKKQEASQINFLDTKWSLVRVPEQRGLEAGPIPAPTEDRLREISDWFAGTVYGDQEEGMEPQRSRKMERAYAETGEAAGGYYNPRSEAEQAARTDELVGLASGMYGGYSQQYGQALLSMVRRGTTLARGVAVNPFLSMNVLKWLDSHPDLRTLMKVDPQQYAEDYKRLSLLIGSSLQAFANSVYEPLQAMQDNADKVTDKALGDAGISDAMGFSDQVLTPLEQDLKDIAEEFNTDISKAALLEGAVQNMENTRDTTEEEEEAILTFSEWVMEGDVASSGVGSFDDTVLAHVTGNGFNAGAFALSLQQKFKSLPDEVAASIAERISARLAAQEVEEEDVPEPNYDARAKRIVATSVTTDSMPKDQKDVDAFTRLTQERLKGNITSAKYREGIESLGVEEETAFAMDRKIQQDIDRRNLARQAAKQQQQEGQYTREATSQIDRLAKELSDVRSEKIPQRSELSARIKEYSEGKIDGQQFREFVSALGVEERPIDQLIALIDENNRRKKAAAKGEKEIAYDTFAKRLTDRLLGVKKETEKATSAVKRLTDAYRAGKLTKRQYIDHLMERGVMPQTALNLASAAGKKMREQVQAARQKSIDKVMKSLSPKKTPDPAKRSRFANLLMTSLEAGILDSQAVRNAFAEAFELHGVTQERIEQMAALLKKIELIRDGIVRDKLMGDFNRLMNTIAPSSTLTGFLMDAYRGSVLGGIGTIMAQFSGLTRLLNPFQAAQQTLWRMSNKSILLNPVNFWRVWSTIAKEGFTAASMARSGVKGLISGETAGIGASPTDLSQVSPVNMRIGLMGARELGQYRSSLKGPFRWLAYPAWWSNRSYNFIRAAEAWTGTIDKNLQFRALAVDNLMQKQGMKFQQAWNTVSDLLSEQKNPKMWADARDVAKKELEQGLITREQLRERSNEIVQDRLDAEWNGVIGNQHREMSAFLNYKQQPVTFAGDLLYTGFTKAARAVPILDFMFLFPRFFVNNFERAFFNSFLSFPFTPFIQTNGDQKYLSERQKRIVRIYGSLEAYKSYRHGASVSGVTNQFVVGMMMALAYGLAQWLGDDDDELPPYFWMTGQPPQKDFTKQKQMTLPGWWQPNTLYLRIPGTKKFLAFNYVQANPDLAVNMSMVGNIADRFMFSELLNYKVDPRTKQRVEEPLAKIGFESVASATMAPMTRSTYRAYFDAIGDVQNGNFKKLAKLLGRPLGETAAGVGLIPAGGPVLRDVQKVVKDLANEGVPKTSKTAGQAFMSGIPYAEIAGELTGNEGLTGVPMINAFGETVSPYSYFSMLSRPQDSSPAVKKASSLLNNLGLAKDGPKEYWVSGDVVEIANDGKRFQMNFSQRAQALEDIGKRFANSLNANQKKLETLKKQKNDKEIQKIVNDLAKQARTTVLNQWRGRIPVLEGDEE